MSYSSLLKEVVEGLKEKQKEISRSHGLHLVSGTELVEIKGFSEDQCRRMLNTLTLLAYQLDWEKTQDEEELLELKWRVGVLKK